MQKHRESNPAFGHRGVRAGLTVPGLYEMQLRAMLGAARACVDRGIRVELEVLVPMVYERLRLLARRQSAGHQRQPRHRHCKVQQVLQQIGRASCRERG